MSLHPGSEIVLEYKEGPVGMKRPCWLVKLERGQGKKAVCPSTQSMEGKWGQTGLAASQGEKAWRLLGDHHLRPKQQFT